MFDFLQGQTAAFLRKLGVFNPHLPSTYEIQEVDFEDVLNKGTANLTEEKAWVIIPEDIEVPVYFYKRNYSFQIDAQGLLQKPKFHTRKCKSIIKFGVDNYNASNSKMVTINNSNYPNFGEPTYNLTLEICLNCVNSIIDTRNINTTEEFNSWLRANYQMVQTAGLDGYPLNWSAISREYRKLKNYRCEDCLIDLSLHKKFLHVHHIDHNKLNCDQSNLKALCIRCHSKQDELHQSNFARDAAKKDLDNFNKLFPE
jgi:hypothetical protein